LRRTYPSLLRDFSLCQLWLRCTLRGARLLLGRASPIGGLVTEARKYPCSSAENRLERRLRPRLAAPRVCDTVWSRDGRTSLATVVGSRGSETACAAASRALRKCSYSLLHETGVTVQPVDQPFLREYDAWLRWSELGLYLQNLFGFG